MCVGVESSLFAIRVLWAILCFTGGMELIHYSGNLVDVG